MYSFTFSADGDTLLFTDDHGQDNTTRANIYYSLRRENFRRIRPYNYGRTAYSLVYMDDGTIFYTTWWEGKVYKMIRNGAIPNIDENAEVAFSLSQISAVGGSHTILFKHPSNIKVSKKEQEVAPGLTNHSSVYLLKTKNTEKESVLTKTNMTSIFVTEKITASGSWTHME